MHVCAHAHVCWGGGDTKVLASFHLNSAVCCVWTPLWLAGELTGSYGTMGEFTCVKILGMFMFHEKKMSFCLSRNKWCQNLDS